MWYERFNSMAWLHAPFAGALIAVMIAVVLLEIALSGYALWYSARNKQKAWFIVFLLVHTLGILEAVYLIWFREDKNDQSGRTIAPPPVAPPTTPSVPATPADSSSAA